MPGMPMAEEISGAPAMPGMMPGMPGMEGMMMAGGGYGESMMGSGDMAMGLGGGTGYGIGREMGSRSPGANYVVAVDPPTKTLIVRGTKDVVAQIEQLVGALDSSEDDLPEELSGLENVRLISFQHRNVFDLLSLLKDLAIPGQVNYVPREAWRDLQAQYRHKSGGSLIVMGPKEDLEAVKELVAALDVRVEPSTKQTGAPPAK
jgi:hypothetical protein